MCKAKLLLSFLILTSSLLFSQQQSKKDLSLQEIWASRTFLPETVSGVRSMEDGIHYTTLERGKDGVASINQYAYSTGKFIKSLVKSSDLIPDGSKTPLVIDEYDFNKGESKILLATDKEPIYRHSSKSIYYIYDLKTNKLELLSSDKQMFASFSPKQNRVAFVRDNNLFIKDIDSGKEIQITQDGVNNKIINGAADWVYEEEFSFDKAFFWSPDASMISFYRFDESRVKEFLMPTYGTLYPEEYRFKYPKAGEENSIVTIHVFDIASGNTREVNTGTEKDIYIPRVQWTADPSVLSVQRLNRHQNKMEVLLCNVKGETQGGTLASSVIYTESSTTYIDGSDDKLFFLDDKQHFIWISDKDGYNHIYLFDLAGNQKKQITSGNWDLTEYLGINEKNKTVYYISAEESPLRRSLYSIKTDGTGKRKLSDKEGFNSVHFSNGFRYYINEYSNANTPVFISLNDASGKQIRVLKDNLSLKNTLNNYKISPKEFFTFTTSEGVELNAWMIKPADFDNSKRYPVFMTIYGGPGSQTVKDQWEGHNYLWHQLMAQKGYIVVSVDNRGTGARGADFKKATYMQLGKLETIDLIESARYIGTLPYVDKNRIGIQGWSYGGYMSSLCITKGADVFKAAIAVAPVTNWRFYDTIYTERYMRTPQENPDGYDTNSPINHVDKLKGKYLIVHGTADDNVHFQNMVEMVNALVKNNKHYEGYFYPDRNHGIYGGVTRLHLFTKMTDFLLENL
jgi:dipeptidyl-peptidase 4